MSTMGAKLCIYPAQVNAVNEAFAPSDLYGGNATRLPDSFTARFPVEYHRKRLFDEQPHALLYIGPFDQRKVPPSAAPVGR
jgi:hypothetical protein